jgi:hypothetical protein
VVYVECDFPCEPHVVEANPASVGGLSGNLIINDDFITRGESGAYYVLGAGLYRALSPFSVGTLGASVEGGAGFKFGRGSFEATYVRVRHWIAGQFTVVPITVGYAW